MDLSKPFSMNTIQKDDTYHTAYNSRQRMTGIRFRTKAIYKNN